MHAVATQRAAVYRSRPAGEPSPAKGSRRHSPPRAGNSLPTPERTPCRRSSPRAARRCSGSRRSVRSTPSRWSISCWMSRAKRSSASTVTSLPSRSTPVSAILTGPLDLPGVAGHRQAALLEDPGAVAGGDDRVEDDAPTATLGLVVDEKALAHPHLRGGQTDPPRLVHGGEHAVAEASDRAVDLGDLRRLRAQHRIAEQPDLHAFEASDRRSNRGCHTPGYRRRRGWAGALFLGESRLAAPGAHRRTPVAGRLGVPALRPRHLLGAPHRSRARASS